MTFCIGISVREGLVALADTRIVKGSQTALKAKISSIDHEEHSAFVMTSGLRSIRDKTVIRLEDRLRSGEVTISRTHELATLFGDELKRVRIEDEAGLAAGGLRFDLNALIGGRFDGDIDGPRLFHVFPEGNWIETTPDAPYAIIGRTHYGTPILDRLLRHDTSIESAIALAYLAFDATRASVTDVDFPIDISVLRSGADHPVRARFAAEQLADTRSWWHDRLASGLAEFPLSWAEPLTHR